MQSRILGIDPGYGRVGLAIIEKSNSNLKLIHSECFETKSKLTHPERLLEVASKVNQICKKYRPNILSIESLLWSKNVKTALGVAEARGVILAEAAKIGIQIKEFNPNSVKVAITGYGKSDKAHLTTMLKKMIEIKKAVKYDDEYDAIALALTCAYSPLSTNTQ